VSVQEGQIVDKEVWLIRPPELYFNPYNTKIHGIREEDVRDKPEFRDLWDTVRFYLEGNIVLAHNATFDMGVLGRTLDTYGITYPELDFACTRLISRRTWPGLTSYSLASVADILGISFKHHDALEDAWACSAIAMSACEETGCDSIEDLVDTLGIGLGCLTREGYRRPERRSPGADHTGVRIRDLKPSTADFDESHPFFRRRVVFTGTLDSMPRKQAMQHVVDVGGECGNSVTKSTDFLVLGDLDFHYYKFKDGEKSQKLRTAESLIANGSGLEILPEADFLKMLKS
jgi:DNA polymerase-3 subunit epsilon